MANFIPAGAASCEIRASNSRFIAHLAPVDTVTQAKAFIATIRQAMPDASHHVYAYVIGHGATTTLGMSDDGEPSGTAGRPALAVLNGSGLGDVVVVVTRYFGGTLLGTGGLVHAYGDAVREVLLVTTRVEKIARQQWILVISYAQYDGVKRTLTQYDHRIDDEQFAADVTITVTLRVTDADAIRAILVEQTAGQIEMISG
ncbi:MAG: YigZ family protein [Chloroflexia bacterium]|nr:YigZ family protein [Chloroflexia bacterium]